MWRNSPTYTGAVPVCQTTTIRQAPCPEGSRAGIFGIRECSQRSILTSLTQESPMAATPSVTSLPLASSYLVEQDWSRYTADQHAVWAELVGRRMPQLEEHACQEYLDGFHNIGLRQDAIPDLAQVNTLLAPRTGWNAT